MDLGIGVVGANLRNCRHAAGALHRWNSRVATQSDAWQRVARFLYEWRNSPAERERRVPFVFLELDCLLRSRERAQPLLFLALDWTMEELGSAAQPPSTGGAIFGSAIADLAARCGMAKSLDSERLAAMVSALPPGGIVAHLGLLLGRPSRGMRLSLLLPAGSVRDYLGRVGLAEQRHSVANLLERYAPLTDFYQPSRRLQLDLDVSPQSGGPVGLSLYPAERGGWPFLLALLAADGHCDARKRQALLDWPGHQPHTPTAGRIERYLSHVKLAVTAGGAVIAKAYLGMAYRHAPR